MMDKSQILSTIESNKGTIKGFGVNKLGLFGSMARNDQTDNSDLDFVVSFSKGKKSYNNYIELCYFLEELFHTKVDLLTFESLEGSIKKRILSEVENLEL